MDARDPTSLGSFCLQGTRQRSALTRRWQSPESVWQGFSQGRIWASAPCAEPLALAPGAREASKLYAEFRISLLGGRAATALQAILQPSAPHWRIISGIKDSVKDHSLPSIHSLPGTAVDRGGSSMKTEASACCQSTCRRCVCRERNCGGFLLQAAHCFLDRLHGPLGTAQDGGRAGGRLSKLETHASSLCASPASPALYAPSVWSIFQS